MASVVVLVVGTTFCLLAGYYALVRGRRRDLAGAKGCRSPKRLPSKDPFFRLDYFINTLRWMRKNCFLDEIHRCYASSGRTFQVEWLGTSIIHSVEPANVQTVFATRFRDWGVEPLREPAQRLCGRGFITTDGPEWERSRTLMKPSLRKANISDFSALEHYLAILIDRIPTDGSTVDLQLLVLDMYLDTSTLFLFGESVDSTSHKPSLDGQKFLRAFDSALFGTGIRIALGPLRCLLPNSRWFAACDSVHSFANRYVEKALSYRAGASDVEGSPGLKKNANLLHTMAQETEDKTELRDQIIQGMMANQETTAVLISNVLFLLARHPKEWETLRNEMLRFRPGELTFETLRECPRLRNVLSETLRFYPVFSKIARVALTDTVLPVGGGLDGTSPIHVSAGTRMETNFYVLHRLPEIWGADAESFRPSRWESFKPKAWEYVPFGGGPRVCLGREKALAEASYVIARLVRSFARIEKRDARPWAGKTQVTTKSAHGCGVALYVA